MTVLKHRIRLEMEKWAVRSPFFYKVRLIFIQHGHAMSCFFSPTLTSFCSSIFVARMVQRQLRVWLLQDVCLWTCSWCYTIFCSLYVSLFIANLNGQDHWRLSLLVKFRGRNRERSVQISCGLSFLHQFGDFFFKVSFCQSSKKHILAGGFKYFLFSPLFGEMIQFD